MNKRFVVVVEGNTGGPRTVLAVFGSERGGFTAEEVLVAQEILQAALGGPDTRIQSTLTIVALSVVKDPQMSNVVSLDDYFRAGANDSPPEP